MSDDSDFRPLAGRYSSVRADLSGQTPAELWAKGKPLAGAKGRGGVGVLEFPGGLLGVSRDFRRGGALRSLLPQSYLDPMRPQRELEVLRSLRRAGVPVVAPLAALARRRGVLFYRLRLITELVVGARPLPGFVAAEPTWRASAIRAAGAVVRAAFAAGLWHPDLHPDNLIARRQDGEVEVYLLDLDRAEIRADLRDRDRDRMLLRMRRYLHRHAERLPVTLRATDIVRFLAGMGLDRVTRRRELNRLQPLYVEELRKHGLSVSPPAKVHQA